jgi:aspartyl-tRNA(Asn)/glutamyl-tRNA(Gln) amidotransferase subunit A
MHEDLCFQTITELSKQIAAKKLSPVELTKAYLERSEELNPKLAVVLTSTKEQALQRAAAAEQEIRSGKSHGPLHGIPYGVKDLLDTKGIRTTGGSSIFKERIPDRDSTVVEKLNNAGAILIQKLAMSEFASGGHNELLAPVPHNPWRLDRSPAGSSSGPGASTAAAMNGFSIGSETGGSIMGPSGANGVSGIRPTYSRVCRYGVMTLAWSLDKIGTLTRSVTDIGVVLEAIAGHDPKDQTSSPTSAFKFRPDPGRVAGRKLGIVRAEFEAVPQENRAIFAKALDVLKQAGFLLEDVTLPDLPYGLIQAESSRTEGGSYYKALFNNKTIIQYSDPVKRADWMAASMLPASDYLQVQRIRALIRIKADELVSKYSALVAPTNVRGSGPIERPAQTRAADAPSPETLSPEKLNTMGNLAGLPGISIPCGFDKDTMSLGLHMAGKAWDEQSLLDIGMVFQKETDFHRRRPAGITGSSE